MNTHNRATLLAASLAAALLIPDFAIKAAAPASPQGAITAREYLNLVGNNDLIVLTNNAKFPNSPDVVSYPARFEWPTGPDDTTTAPGNVKDDYGIQIIGYVYPPTTGDYVFYLASDDTGNLFLSTDDNPANKRLIASEPLWNGIREWNGTPGLENISTNIPLVAGRAYYIEAIVKEGIGGDNLAVGWKMPGGADLINGDLPILGSFLSTIDRVTLAQPFLVDFVGSGGGVWYYITEPSDTVNQSTVQLTLNGNPVTATFTRVGTNATVSFRVATPLAVGSTNTTTLSFADSAARPQTIQKTFVVPAYTTIPASLATPTFSGDGMNVFVHQIDFVDANGVALAGRNPGLENAIYNAETQLADGFLDPVNNNQPYPNVATPPVNSIATVVNWEQLGGEIIAQDPQPDSFNGTEPAAPDGPRPNAAIPGIPGSALQADNNIAASITMYLELKAGWNRLAVNSDDGFTLRVSPGAGEVIEGMILGQFDGGRGSADSFCDLWANADGVYPARLAWWEGDGGANVEFFSEIPEGRKRILINDRTVTGHLKAYPTGTGRAYTKTVLPYPGKVGTARRPQFKIQVIDGLTSFVPNSFVLSVDGTIVSNATVVSAGGTSTLTWSPATDYQFGSSHTGYYVWRENTTPETTHSNALSFTVIDFTPDDLPSYTAGSFWIEFEDFDATGDPGFAAALTLANAMPYAGGAFDMIGATEGVDYNNTDAAADGNNYRTELDSAGTLDPVSGLPENEVSMDGNNGGRFGLRRTGGFDMTTNYKIGWAGSANEWGNYTRVISNGLYRVFGALSHGESLANQLRGDIHEVTSGVGTSTQTTKLIGSFNAPGTGGWGANALVPLNAVDGSPATFKVRNFPGTTTLRFFSFSGDYDWFVLVPATGVTPAIISVVPPTEHTVYRNAAFTWTIEDFSTAVQTNSITLSFGGVNVTSQLLITKPATDLTTVSYTPAQLLNAGASYPFELVFRDNGTPQTIKTNSGTVVTHYLPKPAVDGAFAIEAEDFNYNSGQFSNVVNTMPYAGGAYTNLSAVVGIDYQRANEPSGDIYRIGENPNVPMGVATGTTQEQPGTTPDITRAGWDITQNYSLGWAGGNQWLNYTRQIPANTYQVWAAMSYGGAGPNLLQGNLLKVTSGATTTTQTTEALGVFRGPGTGGWGANALVPMRENPTNSAIKTVQLSGETTLRFENASGDFDYLMLIPIGPSGPAFNPPVLSGNTLTISWSGTGLTLEQATTLTGSPADWSTVPGSPTSPFTVNVGTAPRTFYRLRGL